MLVFLYKYASILNLSVFLDIVIDADDASAAAAAASSS